MPKKTTKTLKKPKTIQVPTSQPSQAELKRAYKLVTQDLFTKLIKAKDQEKITIGAMGSLGAFHKTERKVRSGIHPKGFKGKAKLNTYVYYSLRFKPARKLKAELSRILDKKYNK